ncbi:LamG-like jellyroll fold domain-containing protein [Saccharomonospora glauca]|nr:LamG-like jellyroll fold domain-containing protein [Saccharomonospora glauca]
MGVRSVAVSVVLAVVATLVVLVPAARAEESVEVMSATARAQAEGKPVRVEEETTETVEVLANPDGTFTWRQSLTPQRVKRDGKWRSIDTTWERGDDGVVRTVATPVALTLSPGGSTEPLVVASKDGYEVGLKWRGELPEPILDGPVATYPDVLPDVDLVVTANPEGFGQVLKIKTREAAEHPELEEITYGSHVRNVTVSGDADGLEARDAEGRVKFVGDASRMWDSSGTNASGEVVAPPASAEQATMSADVSGDEITVRPDRAFLTDPDTRYPVFVDPSYNWAGRTNHHVVVQSGYPEERNYDKRTGDLNDLKVGNAGDASGISRSYVELDLSGVKGKRINEATLRTRVRHSHGCSGGGTELWLTESISRSTTWNDQPSWNSKLADFNVHNNVQYCPSQGGVDIKLTNTVKGAVANGRSELTFMLKAVDTSRASWRRFDLDPVLEVEYNSYPNKPTEMSMQGGLVECATSPERPAVPTKTPRLRARVSDPDRGMLEAGFRLLVGVGSEATWDGDEIVTGNVPSGSFAEVTVKDGMITEDGLYTWRLRSTDGQLTSWSDDCEFEVDTVAPDTPTVTSEDYPYDTPAGGLGQTGDFLLAVEDGTDVDHFLYSFTEDQTDDPQTRVPAQDGQAWIRWTPTLDGPQTLFVRSVDRAGNRSEIYRYKVFVRAHDPLTSGLTGHWKLDGDLADESAQGRTLSAEGAPVLDAPGYENSAALLDGATDWLWEPTGVDTAESFSVAAWVKPSTAEGNRTIVSQDGEHVSGFQLQSTSNGEWAFAMFGEDAVGGGDVHSRVRSSQRVEPEVWTHVAGVYDAAAQQLRLYVDGRPAGVRAHSGAWTASGPLAIGRALWSDNHVDHFSGSIDEVRVYDRVLTNSEVALLAQQAVLRAHYAMEEGSGTTTRDEVTGQEAVFHGAASWEVGEFTSVRLSYDQTDWQYLSAPRPDIRTDKSYTVAAWVKADDLTRQEAAVSMGDAEYTPFSLGYRIDTGRWSMAVTCPESKGCERGGGVASSVERPRADEWVHLTGVYDAQKREVRLYINGRFAGKATDVHSWNNSGELLIGRTVWTGLPADPWYGAVDEVRVFAGVPSDGEIFQLSFR